MSLKSQLEAIIYAAEEPVTLEQMAVVLKNDVIASESIPTEGREQKEIDAEVKSRIRAALEQLEADCAASDRGMEVRQVAGGYRMSTKPEHHDIVRGFAKSLKPPIRLSLQALETLAVIAYKQPVTAPEIGEIRGVDSSGVIATLLDRKLITTAGRKQVIGRPILYKTSKEFLLRFGLNDVTELPSLEEFEKLAADTQADLFALPSESSQPTAAEPAAETQSHNAALHHESAESQPEETPASEATSVTPRESLKH